MARAFYIRGIAIASLSICGIAHGAQGDNTINLTGSYRLRYESLDQRFRAHRTGSDQVLLQRLLVNGRVAGAALSADAEIEDSRAWLADNGTPLTTADVDAAQLLQAWAGYRWRAANGRDRLDVKLGRFTMNVGSRRLVARNKFRNTLNAFTGIDGEWRAGKRRRVQAFYTWPVRRRPRALSALLRNAVEADTQSAAQRFWGLFVSTPLFTRWQANAYVFGLFERDTPTLRTKERRLVTPGFRLATRHSSAPWGFEMEGAVQFGHRRATLTATTTERVRAGFVHLAASRRLHLPWSPRVALLYDYASGDRDPTDSSYNRFDSLFGARRFEFGPTGIYGAFARANVDSPSIRISATPSSHLHGFVGYRAVWLASAKDHELGGYDPTGNSGRFVGQQVEFRVRYAPLPHRLRIEAGGAWLDKGSYLKRVPSHSTDGNTVYGYVQVTVKLGN